MDITKTLKQIRGLIKKLNTDNIALGNSVASLDAKMSTLLAEDFATQTTLVQLYTSAQSTDTTLLRTGWNTRAGDVSTFSYYSGVVAGNPSGNTSNVQTVVLSNGGGTVLTQTFTYDANDNPLTVTTS